MKKLTKLMAILMALCLITSSFVGSTLAKYVTEANGADSARVAKFGVVLSAGSDFFKAKYDADDSISVLADNGTDKIIAPGTTGTATSFTISGTPEVDVNFTATLDVSDTLAMVTVPTGDYLDWTTGDDDDDTYNVATNYYPVVWTLKQGGAVKATGNLEAIETYLASISKKYEVEAANAEEKFAALNGTWTLEWVWAFEQNDKADTTLGNKAAGIVDDTAAAVLTTEAFKFNIKAVQVD